jgi:hypothetical protein
MGGRQFLKDESKASSNEKTGLKFIDKYPKSLSKTG